jgi:tetratricopeptide (TPR) repeat protein
MFAASAEYLPKSAPHTAAAVASAPPCRYSAFISYSHADHACVRWLHRALETYRLPKGLVGSDSPFGPVPRRLPPVFRDRDELPASGDLGQELRAALAQSRFQIVICSPRAAKSKWVNEEILSFKRLHGESRTLALIVDGEPYAGDDQECFPAALRFRLAPDGTLSDQPAEPVAADIRRGKDGRRLALLKLIAGLTGVPLDALAQRDEARKQRRLALITAISMSIAIVTIGLAIYAEAQRRVAEAQRRLADKSLEFLVNTFAIANPATENPRTITALTILDRVSKRAGSELKDEPAVSARLLQTTGEIYFNLGLPKESERDLQASLRLEPKQSEGRARTLLRLATLACNRGDTKNSQALVNEAVRSYDHSASYAPALDARVSETRGLIAYFEGHYATAASLFGEAVARYQGLGVDNREEVGRALMSQARALVLVRKLGEADILLAKAVTLYANKYGINNVLTAAAIQNWALNDFERKQYENAQRKIERALNIYDKVFEKNHPKVAASYVLLGRIETARGDNASALVAFEKARLIYAGLYGAHNAAVGDVDFYAAEAASMGGDQEAAIRLLDHTKLIYDASYGPNDPDQVELLMERARVLARGGRSSEASHDCFNAVTLQTKLDPRDSGIAAMRQTCVAIQTGSRAVSSRIPNATS